MTYTVPEPVSSSLDALTAACRSWSDFNTHPSVRLDQHEAMAREVCGLLAHPAQTHAAMFGYATLSVLGLLIFAWMGYITLRTFLRLGRLAVRRIRKRAQA